MGRARERIIRKRETNPIEECNKIQKKFYPELFSLFDQIRDPRHSSYTDYSCREMFATLYYKELREFQVCRE